MPIRSRLLRLLIIPSALALASTTWAMSDFKPVKPKPTAAASESANTSLPFDNQSVPKATSAAPTEEITSGQSPAPAPVAKPAAIVVESKAESYQRGNNQCSSNENNSLQKSLLLTAFPRLTPNSSNAGALNDAEHQLPQMLGEQLVAKHKAITPIQLTESLPSPSASDDTLLAQQIQKLARNQHTQLVLTGEIMDMAMTHPEATYNPGLYTRFLNGLFDFIEVKNRFDKRERVFSFQVNLRDGFTGQTLFNKRYDTYGIWGLTKEVGFGSPLFWNTDYGQQIKGLVKMASKEVGAVIQCQPYIAQIDARPGQNQILLQGGANNGLRSGDTLALYQLVVQGSETDYDKHQVRLVNRNAAIELREVYPSHSVGVINSSSYLTGQFLAVSP
ncbi:flagella assembly protein FlgT middle domain-containing protein [Cellvibrio sp.]|uniref:flagella assembly protein FlgT middle domain-containing protein n=1 Tax=Cellvibrio sp. TaxID=1965322 RepID=UPI00396476DF